MIIRRRVVGHSMVPSLPPNTIVWGVLFFRKLKKGHVVVIAHDGREKIKRIDQIKEGQVFVLGDHPQTSTDSRQFGWLPITSVKAKIIWPRSPKS